MRLGCRFRSRRRCGVREFCLGSRSRCCCGGRVGIVVIELRAMPFLSGVDFWGCQILFCYRQKYATRLYGISSKRRTGVASGDGGFWLFGWCEPVRPGHTPLCCRSSGLRSLAPLSRCERGVGLLLRGSPPARVSLVLSHEGRGEVGGGWGCCWGVVLNWDGGDFGGL